MFSKCFQLEKIIKKNQEKIDADFDKFIQDKMIQYDNYERNLTSVKKYTKLGINPGGKTSARAMQPFSRGLFPYSFKGRVLYKESIINHIGCLIKNKKTNEEYYYPYCVAKTKQNLKEYISALIQGFPKDRAEAERYGMVWNDGWKGPNPPVDNKSGIKKEYEPDGRIIRPINITNNTQFLEKFKECTARKSLKIENSSEATQKKFTFLKPLTIEKLFIISGKKIAAQAIPEESLIAYCYDNMVYYRFEDKILQYSYDCKNGHGFIHNKKFFPMEYKKCKRKEDILQYCEQELNESLKDKKIYKLLFFTEEGEGFYWSSKGYPELKCNANFKKEKSNYTISLKDVDNNFFRITENKEIKGKHSTSKEFPRSFFYKKSIISKLHTKYRFEDDDVLVNGVYNDFGQIYQGKPVIATTPENKEIYENTVRDFLTNNINTEDILMCFRKKNIENFIKIVHPVDLNFFKISTSFVNKKLKKINIPFSTQEILGGKISNFTQQFIDKEITDFKKSAVFFYDDNDTIKFFYAE